MFCRNCGKQQDDTAGFCDGCGTQLRPAAAAPVAAPATATKPKASFYLALAVGVVVLIGAVVAALTLLPEPTYADYEVELSESLEDVMAIPDDIYETMVDAGDTTYGDRGIGTENLAAFQDTLARSSSAIERARADVDGLNPPKDYERQHTNLLADLDTLLEVTESLSGIVSRIDPDDTADDISGQYYEQFYSDMRDGAAAYSDIGVVLGEVGLEDLLPAILEGLEDPEDL